MQYPLTYTLGSPLNRLSFLRSKTPFLRAALPHAKFLLLKNLNALSSPDPTHLAFLAYQDVKSVVGTAYDLDEDKLIAAYDSSLSEEGAPIILFLGVDEDYVLEKERGEGEVAEPERFAYEGYRGRPYFAVDLTTKRVEEAIGMKLEENGRIFQRNVELVPKEGMSEA